jgi:hypothetical protein
MIPFGFLPAFFLQARIKNVSIQAENFLIFRFYFFFNFQAILVLENDGDDVVDKRTTEALTDGNEKIVKSHFNTICLPTKNYELNGYNNCYVASWTGNNQRRLPR